MRWVLAAAFVVAWSSGFVGATLAEQTGVATWPLLAWRYLMTAAIVLAACAVIPSARRAFIRLSRRDLCQQAVLGVLSHVVFLGGVFVAASNGLDAGLSALVCALQPLLVTAASRVFFADRVTWRQWAGLAVALAGVGLSVGGVSTAGVASVGLVVMGLVGLSSASLLERKWEPHVPVLVSLAIQVCVSAVVFVVLAFATDGMQVEPSATLAFAIGWLVLLSGLGGYAAFILCLRRLGATTTSTLLYLTAPVTMLWAWAMFGQAPTAMQWIGLVLVLAGVALATRSTPTGSANVSNTRAEQRTNA